MNTVPPSYAARGLEDGFCAILIALSAKMMRRLAVLHSRLRGVGENAGIMPLQFVALLLTFPTAKAHDLLFKLAHALQRHRMRILCRKQRRLGFEKMALQIETYLRDSSGSLDTVEGLQKVLRRTQAAQSGTYL